MRRLALTGVPDLEQLSPALVRSLRRLVNGYNESPFQARTFTTTERDALTALNGTIIYNGTVSRLQGYDGTVWADLARAWVDVTAYGAVGNGSTNNFVAFGKALAAVPEGGTLYIPRGTYVVDFTGADVVTHALVACNITTDNIHIRGEGAASIISMTGITAAQLNAGSDDPSDAGNDAATVFNFNGVNRGSIRNLHFTGTGGGTAIVIPKARAKGIGVMNSQRIQISGITGIDIPGNLINLRGNSGAEATSTSYCTVESCIAENCSENGINFMGGTYRCSLIGCQSHGNQYHGFESGTTALVCVGNSCKGNAKYGVAHTGVGGLIAQNALESNTSGGVNLNYSATPFTGSDTIIKGNWIKNDGATSGGVVIAAVAAGTVNHFTIANNWITTAWYGININSSTLTTGCADFSITGNYIKNTGTTFYGLFVQPTADRFLVSGNVFEGGASGFRANPRAATNSTLARTSNVVTVTTSAAHGYSAGDIVAVFGSDDATFHGYFTIATVPLTTTYTYAQTAGDASATGGTSNALQVRNFSVTGNYFYNQATDAVILQGYRCRLSDNTIIPAGAASRSGQMIYASQATITNNAFHDQSFSLNASLMDTNHRIYDNSGSGAPLRAAVAYDPPNVVDGAGVTTTVTVTGAALGDLAGATFSLDTQGILLYPWVSAANTVSVRFQNESGGALDLGSGTLTALVEKR